MKMRITSGRTLFHTLGAVLLLTAPASLHAASVTSNIGSGRLLPTMAAVMGLAGVFIGRQALIRSRRTGSSKVKNRAILALVLGLTGLAIGILHAVNSAGGFGTGNGLAGAIVAIALGLTGMILGGLALTRSRRIATDINTKKPL